ncbi:MAG: hypothetical protein RML93_13460 [Anaerolineales bacterium]|nr:hypothetical protein [Anaerolineales bacterium]MDW8448281.1 hypothetical protein [Anaerolineales bacterium]
MEMVECRSEFAYPERPLALWWQEQRLEVREILAQWRTPEGKGFWVRTWDGQVFELFYAELSERWSVTQV